MPDQREGSMRGAKTILFLFMLLNLISTSSFADERQVRVAGDPYPPWAEGEVGSASTSGIAVEIVEELFKRLDMEARVIIYPFKRGLERVKHGEEDVILMVSQSEERAQYMLFTLPVREVKFVFYHLAENTEFEWKDWSDLRRYNIGSVSGYNIGDDWTNAIKDHELKVEEVKTDVFNIEKLLRGRVDAIVTDYEVMQRIIAKNPDYQGKVVWHEKPVFESVNNFGISKKSFLAPMLPRINEVIQGMKDDGTFDKIFCAHGKTYRESCE